MKKPAVLLGLDVISCNLPFLHARAIADVLRLHGIIVDPKDIVKRFPDRSSGHIFEMLVQKARMQPRGKRDPDVLRQEKWKLMETLPADDICLIPSSIAFIRRMYKEGNPLAIVSAAPQAFIKLVLQAGEVSGFFSETVSVDDVGKRKSEPDVVLRAATLLGYEPANCVVIEHRESGMIGAKSAGARCFAFVERSTHVDVTVDGIVSDLRHWEPPRALAA